MSIGKADLRLPVAHGARLVALDILDDASDASQRLVVADGARRDAEALHDFRVAVRRLRSWLRAFDDELGRSVGDKQRKALKRIARATNPGRDLEVQLEWLERAGRGLGRRRREGAAWMTGYLTAAQRADDDALDAVVRDEFPRVRGALEERLSTYAQTVRTRRAGATAATLAEAIASRLGPHGDELGAALDGVHALTDEAPAHTARIVAKRLRYLLEPAARHVKGGRAAIGRLKRLQDGLGALHDTHVMSHQLLAALERSATAEVRRMTADVLGEMDRGSGAAPDGESAARPAAPAPRAAILALAQRLRGDMEKAFKAVHRDWLDGRHRRFGAELSALAERLRAGFPA